jgi:hypothetical protein
MISFCLNAKLYKQRTSSLSHGLSDEEKKNASDKFELHIELGNRETLLSYLLVEVFSFP